MKKLLIISSIAIFASCSADKNKVANSESGSENNKTQIIQDPTILDDQLVLEDGSINIALSDSAATLYNRAYSQNPKDSIAPYYLMKSADIQRHIPGKALLAIKKYWTLEKTYSDHQLAPLAFFMSGLTFDENLNDKERASKVYVDFLERYPEHDMATEVKNLLALAQNDASSDLEQVKEWQKNAEENN